VRNILDDCHENKKLLIKLPRWIQKDWSKTVSHKSSGKYPSFKEFSAFISKIDDRVNNPIFNDIVHERNPKGTKNTKALSTSTQIQNGPPKECKKRSICDVCQKGHPTSLHGDWQFTATPATTKSNTPSGTCSLK
jgi:hypothetical protein